MTREEINKIVNLHQKWLVGKGGERANLQGADLRKADLRRANLEGADLEGAKLRKANLEGAKLEVANLREADLERANLEGADLWGAKLRRANLEGANLEVANFEEAILEVANLTEARLEEANLWRADLKNADLEGANLEGANLREADLNGANLTDVENFPFPDLNILRSQKGKVRAFKVVNRKNEGVFQGGIKYEIGKTVEEDDYDPDERVLCSRGLNVATLDWCLKNKGVDDKILVVEFYTEDIVAIPYATNGKFRVKKCKVVEECVKEWRQK